MLNRRPKKFSPLAYTALLGRRSFNSEYAGRAGLRIAPSIMLITANLTMLKASFGYFTRRTALMFVCPLRVKA